MNNVLTLIRSVCATGTVMLFALVGCAQSAGRVGPTAEPVFYPLPPSPPRIAFVGSINDATVMGHRPNRMSRFLFGHDPEPPRTITKPFGLAAGNETLLVCDTQQNVVHVLDFKRNTFGTLGASGRGKLLKPVAVALDEQANRYVADTLRHQVVVFSPDNEPLRELGQPGDTEFKPVALAIRAGRLYVVNSAKHRVEVLDPQSGALVEAIGGKGEGPGQLLFPNGLAIDSAGRVYVTDMMNGRVQVFSADGSLVRSFGRPGDRAGEFSRPKHLAVDSDDIAYVVDAGFQRVQMFDGDGRVLMLFGGPGEKPGNMTLPAGICIDRTLLPHFATRIPDGFSAEYLIFVSDQFGRQRIGVYAFGQMASAGTP